MGDAEGDITGNTHHPDYGARDLPDTDDEPYEEWHAYDRRTYVLDRWTDVGTHRLLNKSRLAEQFGVSRDTIYNDIDAVAEHVDRSLGKQHGAETVNILKRAVAELLDEGEYKKAAKLQLDFGQWLADRGAIDKEPERHEVATADASDVDEDAYEFLDEVF